MSESEAYAKVMGAVEKVQPQRVEEFQGWCQYFGSAPNEEAEVKAKEFYEYLSTAFGPAFAAGLAPDLAQLIPDEMKKTVLLKCAGIDYVSPTTVAQATSAPAPSADSIADPMAFLATTQDEDVKLTPEEEAALKEREEAKAKAEADQLTALQHESVEGLAGSELAAAEARNAEKDVVKDLQQCKTSMWDMTKMAFRLGLAEAGIVKAVTNEKTAETRQAVNQSVGVAIDNYADAEFARLREEHTTHYMHESQKTVQDIMEGLHDDCLWEEKESEFAILNAAQAMVKDMCFKKGGAEQQIKSWICRTNKGGILSAEDTLVFCLTSGSFYEVFYNPSKMKLTKLECTTFHKVAYILSDRTPDGAPVMTIRTRDREDVNLFGFITQKAKAALVNQETQYQLDVRVAESITSADIAATTLEMVRATQQVHRRFITASASVESISSEAMDAYKNRGAQGGDGSYRIK